MLGGCPRWGAFGGEMKKNVSCSNLYLFCFHQLYKKGTNKNRTKL